MAASALQSFVSQLWTSQALVAECSDIEKHKLFGVYGGVIVQRPEMMLLLFVRVGVWFAEAEGVCRGSHTGFAQLQAPSRG